MNSLIENLKSFAFNVLKLAETDLKKGILLPDKILYLKNKFDSFTYGQTGPVVSSIHSSYYNDDNWQGAIMKIITPLKSTAEFENCKTIIAAAQPLLQDPESQLVSLTYSILYTYFTNREIDYFPLIFDLLQQFAHDLNKCPVEYKMTIYLKGIVLNEEKIEIKENVILRRPKVAEFEEPKLALLDEKHFPDIPSAILEITDTSDAFTSPFSRDEVEHYCTLLRLFGVGAVAYLSYKISSKAVIKNIQTLGIISSNINSTAPHFYNIGTEHGILLSHFQKVFEQERAKQLYSHPKLMDYLTIAYDRYSETFLESTFERKVMNVVMALEALFSNDNAELSFKLATRVSKLLSLVNKQGLSISRDINAAYKIRSKFSHGSHFDQNKKQKIIGHYHNEKQFVEAILDYLRISILIILVCNFKKEILITDIDNSLIDNKCEIDLREKLIPALLYI